MKKPTRKRKNPFQLKTLERTYSMEMYPSKATRAELSVKLGLTDCQLQRWFCCKRLKEKQAAGISATKSLAPATVRRRGMTKFTRRDLTMITHTEKRSQNKEELLLLLPDDIIAEILSRLPIKCVLRCRCVCKSWQSITQRSFFIEKHASRTEWLTVYKEKYVESKVHAGTFRFHRYCDNGLVLDVTERFTKFRIRNPATNQVLEVPEDQLEEPEGWHSMVMSLNYKLICFHSKMDPHFYGIRIFSVENDLSWRPLPITLVGGHWLTSLAVANDDCVLYITSLSYYEVEKSEFVRLNMEDESFIKFKPPQGFESVQSLMPGRTSRDVYQMFVWDGKLTIGFLIKAELHLWVLESCEKQIWSEKKVISLDFVKDHPNLNNTYTKYVTTSSKGLLNFCTGNALLECDIHSKKVTHCAKTPPPGERILYRLKPTLLSLKGMHSGGLTPRLLIA